MDTTLEALATAAALVPVLRQRAAQAEQLRQVPPESIEDLRASGLIRIGIPERFGGFGLDIDTAFEVASELGRGCASTAWCYAVWSAHNWWLGYFPEQCQDEVFGSGSDLLISSALNPSNSTIEVLPDGYRISGRWTFSSGCDAASWALLAGGASPEDRRWLLLPRTDYDILDTWFAVGLRGTGSKDIVARDVFVPNHRAINPNHAGDSDLTGWELHKRASYGVPLTTLTEWALAAPIIGMAQGVVDEFTSRLRSGNGRATVARQLRLAEASAEIEAARVLYRAEVRAILDSSGAPERFSSLERARCARNASFTAQLCLRAVHRLYEVCGAAALMETEPIQRLHCDINAACQHGALSWDAAAERFGGQALGVDS